MLDMGFLDDVEFVVNCLVHDHQTLMFSATLPEEIRKLAARYLKDPVIVELNMRQLAPTSLRHSFMQVEPRHRLERLLAHFNEAKPNQVILFCNSRTNADMLFRHLRDELDSVELIHGGMEQNKRTSLFRRFRRKEIRYMVATDVAGRGLDFEHVDLVVNFDFPTTLEAYTHRTGRTARMGRVGVALTLVSRPHLRDLRRLIETNRIEPIWVGEAPDLTALPKGGGGKSSGRGRRPGRGGGHSQGRSGPRHGSRGRS